MKTNYYERSNLGNAHKKIIRRDVKQPPIRMIAFEDLPSLQKIAKDGGYWVIDEYGNRDWVNLRYINDQIEDIGIRYDLIGNNSM